MQSIPYEDTVREALCFGWIDSLVKRLDDDRYARKLTPRRPTSKWSDINRKRWRELEAADVAKALKTSSRAWAFFQKLSPTDRRHFVVWIHLAKRPKSGSAAFANRSVC